MRIALVFLLGNRNESEVLTMAGRNPSNYDLDREQTCVAGWRIEPSGDGLMGRWQG